MLWLSRATAVMLGATTEAAEGGSLSSGSAGNRQHGKWASDVRAAIPPELCPVSNCLVAFISLWFSHSA